MLRHSTRAVNQAKRETSNLVEPLYSILRSVLMNTWQCEQFSYLHPPQNIPHEAPNTTPDPLPQAGQHGKPTRHSPSARNTFLHLGMQWQLSIFSDDDLRWSRCVDCLLPYSDPTMITILAASRWLGGASVELAIVCGDCLLMT